MARSLMAERQAAQLHTHLRSRASLFSRRRGGVGLGRARSAQGRLGGPRGARSQLDLLQVGPVSRPAGTRVRSAAARPLRALLPVGGAAVISLRHLLKFTESHTTISRHVTATSHNDERTYVLIARLKR